MAGGEGAPDLGETIGNLLVNLIAITVFAVLFKGESEQSAATQQKVAREEEFGRLRLSLAEDAEDATVSRLRGNCSTRSARGSSDAGASIRKVGRATVWPKAGVWTQTPTATSRAR